MKLLSLFDGSGGFPLAGALCGIDPIMASEVEPYPIAVTRSRFPKMMHLGDVSKINGAEIEPVDLITFGSPCQDLSVANGLRAGIKDGKRSSLFFEAIRIIKEMRRATNGVYPKYIIWENVCGAFSSNKGEDLRSVLESICQIADETVSIPRPEKWTYAGNIVGDGYSVAWRVFDAQYWGVAQRRRRIYLVADLRGERAGKILFEREGLRGYSETSGTQGQTAAGDFKHGPGAADSEKYGIGINGQIAATLDASYYKGCGMRQGIEREVVCVDQGGGKSSCNVSNELAPTLTCTHGGEPVIAFTQNQLDEDAHPTGIGIDGYNGAIDDVAATLGVNCGMSTGRNGVIVRNVQGDQETITENSNPTNDNILIDSIGGQAERAWRADKAPTLKATHYKSPPCVMQAAGFKPSQGSKARGMGWETEKSPTLLAGQEPGVCISFEPGAASRCGGHFYENISGTLRATPGDNQMTTAYSLDSIASNSMKSKNPHSGCREVQIEKTLDTTDPNPSKNQGGIAIVQAYSVENHPNDSRVKIDETGKVQALTSRMGTGGGNVPMVMEQKIINLNKGDVQSKTVLDPSGITPSLYAGECRGGGGECYVLDTLQFVNQDNVPTVMYPEKTGPLMASGYNKNGTQEAMNGMYVVESLPIQDQATRFSGKRGDKAGTLDASYYKGCGERQGIEREVVCYGLDRASYNQGKNAQYDFSVLENQSPTMIAKGPNACCYWNGGQTAGTLTANNAGGAQRMPDKENFNCVIQEKGETQYIVRRLTPTECCRLQGFPDGWGEIDPKEDFTDEEYKFWYEVRNTYAAINGRKMKVYTKQQMLTWYNKLHTDSAEYKMWGNGIALPTALYVMQGISEALKEQEGKN